MQSDETEETIVELEDEEQSEAQDAEQSEQEEAKEEPQVALQEPDDEQSAQEAETTEEDSDEELESYSEGVQRRIRKLTAKYREEERQRQAGRRVRARSCDDHVWHGDGGGEAEAGGPRKDPSGGRVL